MMLLSDFFISVDKLKALTTYKVVKKPSKTGQDQIPLIFVFFDRYWQSFISSGIRQKGESQNGCFKKVKHAKISEKQTFLTP